MNDSRRLALATSLLAAGSILFTGCAGNAGQAPGAPPVAGAAHSRSWIDLTNPPTVFVGSLGDSAVYGYSQKTGALTETIADVPGPSGLATDGSGNLYVSTPLDYEVLVYPPGSTTPSLTLTKAGPRAAGIAVSKTGQVAVVSASGPNGFVLFYAKSATKPFATRALPANYFPSQDAYDASGNLWVETSQSQNCTVFELVGGGHGTQIQQFTLSPQMPECSGIAVDSANHFIVNAVSNNANSIYTYQLPNLSSPISTTPITGDGSSAGPMALTASEGAAYVVESLNSPDVARVKYPAGGSPRQTFSVNGVTGIAVSPWLKP
jgi:hypothetical protein